MADSKKSLLSKLSFWAVLPVGFHLVRVLTWFSEVDFTSRVPLLSFDYAQYWARVLRIHQFLAESGWFWGYDPYEMAGLFSGPQDLGVFLLGLICHAFSPLIPLGTSLLLIEFLGFLCAPFLIYAAGRAAGFSRKDSWIAFSISLLALFNLDVVSHSYFPSALFGYYLAACACPLLLAVFYRALNSSGWTWWALFIPFSVLLTLLHPGPIPALLIFGAFLIFISPPKNFKWFLLSMLLLLSFGWLVWKDLILSGLTTSGIGPLWGSPAGGESLRILLSPLKPSFADSIRIIVLGGLVAVFFSPPSLAAQPRQKFVGVSLCFLVILAVSVFGTSIPVINLFPTIRFTLFLWLLLAFAAAPAISTIWKTPSSWSSGLKFLLVASLLPFLLQGDLNARFQNKVTPGYSAMRDFFREKSPAEGRILMDTTPEEDSNILDLLPRETGFSTVGGPTWPNFLEGNFSNFKGYLQDPDSPKKIPSPAWAGSRLNEIPARDFVFWLNAFNVKWVVASDPETKKIFSRFPQILAPAKAFPPYEIFSVAEPAQSWFQEGGGRLSYRLNELTLSNVSEGNAILKFHWSPLLRSDPPGIIFPAPIGNSPIPFIGLDNKNPGGEIRITFKKITD